MTPLLNLKERLLWGLREDKGRMRGRNGTQDGTDEDLSRLGVLENGSPEPDLESWRVTGDSIV